MRSLVTWVLTEPPRSPWGHFWNDFCNGLIAGSLILAVCILAH